MNMEYNNLSGEPNKVLLTTMIYSDDNRNHIRQNRALLHRMTAATTRLDTQTH